MIMSEGDIKVDFSQAVSAKRLDDVNHGLSHCMKAVDFIVELPNKILFIEVKDPQNPQARTANRQTFIKNLTSGNLIKKDLTYKCRDSFLYEHCSGNLNKPVYYLVLIGLDTLTEAELNNQSDILKRHLPVDGPSDQEWPNKFVHGCMIMNISTWNISFSQFPASRIS